MWESCTITDCKATIQNRIVDNKMLMLTNKVIHLWWHQRQMKRPRWLTTTTMLCRQIYRIYYKVIMTLSKMRAVYIPRILSHKMSNNAHIHVLSNRIWTVLHILMTYFKYHCTVLSLTHFCVFVNTSYYAINQISCHLEHIVSYVMCLMI